MFSIKGTPRIIAASLAVGIVVGAAVFGGLDGSGHLWARLPAGISEAVMPTLTAEAPRAAKTDDVTDLANRLTTVYTRLAQEVTPAVVRIESRLPAEQTGANMQDIPEPFRQFFNMPQGPSEPQHAAPEEMAGGSGFHHLPRRVYPHQRPRGEPGRPRSS